MGIKSCSNPEAMCRQTEIKDEQIGVCSEKGIEGARPMENMGSRYIFVLSGSA